METHESPGNLIALELGVLGVGEREGVERHLRACASCRSRLDAVRTEVAAIAGDVHDAIDERSHVPGHLLVEYAAAPSGVGAELSDRIEEHLAQCPRCAGELQRMQDASSAAWGRAPGGLAAPSATRARPFPRGLLWPCLATAAVSAMIILVLLPRRGTESKTPDLLIGPPLRLLGDRGASGAPLPAAAAVNEYVLLFVKVAESPDPVARFELILQGASGRVTRTPVAGSAFDRTGALGIWLPVHGYADGERIELRIESSPPDGTVHFMDAFTVQRSTGR